MGLFSALGGFFSRKKTPITKPAGSDGLYLPSGYVWSKERKADLQGRRRWITYSNTVVNCITVAAAVRAWNALHGSAEWEVEPNKLGGAAAEKCAELVRDGLLEAQMSRSWKGCVRKIGFGRTFFGFSIFEQLIRRRRDGILITADLQHRPQSTVRRWDKPDEQSAWIGIEQQTDTGELYYVPRDRLLYVVDDDITESPEGVGVLRFLIEHARRLERLEQLEGWSYETDLRGIPKSYAPLRQLAQEAVTIGAATDLKDFANIKKYIDVQTKYLRDLMDQHVKTPDISVMLDSEPYADLGQEKKPIALRKWDFDIVKGQGSGQAEIRQLAINGINREIARVMACEWMLMGDGEGARAVHGDKTAMFAMQVNSSLDAIGDAATAGPARRLVALNGHDPDTCTPRVKPQPIPHETIEAICNSILSLAQAGDPLRPGDPLPDVIRARAKLPPRPELTPEVITTMQRISGKQPATDPSAAGSPPDPSKGEVDVPVDDMKPTKKGRVR